LKREGVVEGSMYVLKTKATKSITSVDLHGHIRDLQIKYFQHINLRKEKGNEKVTF